MSALALGLVLVAALMHAAWNLVVKRSGGGDHFSLVMTGLMSLMWAPLGLWAGRDVLPHWGWREWGALVASAVANRLYFHTLVRGYAASDLSVVYPVARGTGPLIASLAAVLVLDESMSLLGAAGLVLVVAGIFLVAGGWSLASRAQDDEKRRRVRAGVGWGVATGIFIAAYTLVDGYAVKVLAMSPLLLTCFCNVVRLPMHLPTLLRDPAGFRLACRTQWKPALVVAVLAPLAYLLVLHAVQLAPLSHVAPAREVSMLFAALLGGHLLGEADRGPRLLGAACIALGVIGLALG